MKKYKEKFERDYHFYFSNKGKFTFTGSIFSSPLYDKNGKDAKYVFFIYDSTGQIKPCKEPELFTQLMICKKAINLQIKMWAEGQEDCLIPLKDLLSEFIDPPEWVEEALRKQIQKETCKRYLV